MEALTNHIVSWLKDQMTRNHMRSFVVGISGGVDSAVVSALCGLTNYSTYAVNLPIRNSVEHNFRAARHMRWLEDRFPHSVYVETIDLDEPYTSFKCVLGDNGLLTGSRDASENLTLANMKSRLRMVALYAFANMKGGLVVGTGNKVEDFGIGFCTKGGDQMVDISPIGDLTKSQVWGLAEHLGINSEIIEAKPSDGLWADSRSDEDQIGASYEELEWAMDFLHRTDCSTRLLSKRQLEVLGIYLRRHNANKHKMRVPPVCRISE